MTRVIVRYGIIAGLIVGIPMIVQMVTGRGFLNHTQMAMVVGYLTMLVALTAVFLGIKHYRDNALGGVIKFGPALLLGLGISVVAGILYAISWEVSLALTHYDFADSYAQGMITAAKAKGMTGEGLDKVTADAAAFVKMYSNPFLRFGMTFIEIFPVGVLISLISAALLRNSRLLPARAA